MITIGLVLIVFAAFVAGILSGFIPVGVSLPFTERQAFILGYYGCGVTCAIGLGLILIGIIRGW